MKNLEDELRKALRRIEPPAGFTERVRTRLERNTARKNAWRSILSHFFQRPRLRWALAGALAGILLVGRTLENRRRERLRIEGETAKAQLKKAMEIASSRLNSALRQIERVDHRKPAGRNRQNSEKQMERL